MDGTQGSLSPPAPVMNVVISVRKVDDQVGDRAALTGCSVFMERVYCKQGVPIRRYPIRG